MDLMKETLSRCTMTLTHTFNIGDIVKHIPRKDRYGIVVEINKNTILVQWFNGVDPLMYYPYSITKVS